jgi:hypothetical protein
VRQALRRAIVRATLILRRREEDRPRARESSAGSQSRAEIKPRRRRRQQQLVRHDLVDRIDEGLPTAVHRHDNVGRERLQLGDDLIGVFRCCRAKVEAADQRMQFVDAGDLLGLPDGVKNAHVAARCDHDEASVLHVEAGGVFVGMLIGDDLALKFSRRKVRILRGVAAEPVLDAVLTIVLGKIFSMPERLIWPVVKA